MLVLIWGFEPREKNKWSVAIQKMRIDELSLLMFRQEENPSFVDEFDLT